MNDTHNTEILTEMFGTESRGECSCGWIGPWRDIELPAIEDMLEHLRELTRKCSHTYVRASDDTGQPKRLVVIDKAQKAWIG